MASVDIPSGESSGEFVSCNLNRSSACPRYIATDDLATRMADKAQPVAKDSQKKASHTKKKNGRKKQFNGNNQSHNGQNNTSAQIAENKQAKKTSNHQVGNVIVLMQMLLDIIKNTKYNEFDFYLALHSHKDKCYRVATELVNDGLPLIHMCIIHKRYSFLAMLFDLGWFNILLRQKAGKESEYSGMTAMQVAEHLNLKKAITELKDLTAWEDSLSSAMKAARAGDISRLRSLIKTEGEDLHYRDVNNGNALYWAVVHGSLPSLQLLLHEGGMDPSMKTFKGGTLLHVAASLGHAELISILVTECKIDPSVTDSSRKTALDRVAENGDIATFNAFRECGTQIEPNFSVLAAFNGRLHLLQHCFETAMININTGDVYNRTPLLRAAEGAHQDSVEYLLERGADITAVATTNRNVLHVGAESGNTSVLQTLINKLESRGKLQEMLNALDRHNGVDNIFIIRGRDKGREAWHYVEVTRYLVPYFLKKSKSGTIDVAAFGKVAKSGWGANPDQEAIDYIEDMCRKRRLNLDAPLDRSPLQIALSKGHTEVAEILIEAGASVSQKDHFGSTPIMTAASKNLPTVVQLLERKGASLLEVNKDGLNALEIAERNESEEVVNYLKGRDYLGQVESFVNSELMKLKRELSSSNIDRLRRNGVDVRRHIIDTLRDFRIDVNQTLLEMGSGPILEESQ